MIVALNSPGFSYDVHSLVKAFYPSEDVSIVSDGEADKADISVHVSAGDIGDGLSSGTIRVSSAGAFSEEEYEDLPRSEVKNLLKRTLYDVLCRLTAKILPWGTMTGIRPVKVPMKLINEGADDEAVRRYMKSVYMCSDEKIALATQIAHTEKKVIDSLLPKGYSLYIGIPFCPTTCLYCSFTSYPIASWSGRTDEYLRALKSELSFFSDHYKDRCCDSIYIGGGTPTTLSAAQLSDLIGFVKESFDISHLREFTVEAGRPDSITDEKLVALFDGKVTRISINPQTMNDKTLRLIGRRHTVDDVYSAFDAARRVGFSNINTDLILGLPGEDESDVANTFAKIKELAPESITIHSMAIKRAAAMQQFLDENSNISCQNTPQMMQMAHDLASSLGLVPYYLYRQKNMAGNFENVGFSQEDSPGIYNIVIMEEITDIAAAGAGTISKRVFDDGRIERCDNVKDVGLYIERIEEMIDRKKKLFSEGE